MTRSFDRVAARYDATRALPLLAEQAITAGLLRLIATAPPGQVLDIGIGTGRITLPLARAGCACVGIDPAAGMLALAQEKSQSGGRLALVRADATSLPFAAATFAAALIVHVLHLVPAWPQALDEVQRVLKPGGVLLYGSEHVVEEASSWALVDRQWRAILGGYGVTLRGHRAVDGAVLAALDERGLRPETTTIAAWSTATTVGVMLEQTRARVYSASWTIPDEIFPLAVADFAAWVTEHYPDPESVLTLEHQFRVTAARQPTSS